MTTYDEQYMFALEEKVLRLQEVNVELSTHSEMLHKSLIETVMLLKIEQGMKVEQAKIHAEVMCDTTIRTFKGTK